MVLLVASDSHSEVDVVLEISRVPMDVDRYSGPFDVVKRLGIHVRFLGTREERTAVETTAVAATGAAGVAEAAGAAAGGQERPSGAPGGNPEAAIVRTASEGVTDGGAVANGGNGTGDDREASSGAEPLKGGSAALGACGYGDGMENNLAWIPVLD